MLCTPAQLLAVIQIQRPDGVNFIYYKLNLLLNFYDKFNAVKFISIFHVLISGRSLIILRFRLDHIEKSSPTSLEKTSRVSTTEMLELMTGKLPEPS